MLTVAIGKSTMSRTQVQLWYNRFKQVPRQKTRNILKQGNKWFWVIVKLLLEDVWLWYWNQSPIIPIVPMEAYRRAKIVKSTSNLVKFEGFAHCLLQLQRAMFNCGITVNDDPRPGRSSNLWKYWSSENMILDNCRKALRELANDVGISFGSC